MRRSILPLLLLAILPLAPCALHAQEVIASTGNSFSNASGSLTFTVGEVVIETHSIGGIIITQGFNQPADDFTTGLPAPAAATGVTVFPNPTRNELFIDLGTARPGWTGSLFDLCGRLVITNPLMLARNTLDLSDLANGTYNLRLTDARGELTGVFQLIIAH